MPHDVFISYSKRDEAAADAIRAALEADGIACWIAPRDVLPGRSYPAEIIRAISTSRLFLLVWSSSSNDSPQVLREVERAADKRVPILPLRIELAGLTEDLEYYLGVPQWLDAVTPPLSQHLPRVTQTVRTLLGDARPPAAERAAAVERPTPAAPPPVVPNAPAWTPTAVPTTAVPTTAVPPTRRRWGLVIGGAMAVVALLLYLTFKPSSTPLPSVDSTTAAIPAPRPADTAGPTATSTGATEAGAAHESSVSERVLVDETFDGATRFPTDSSPGCARELAGGRYTIRNARPDTTCSTRFPQALPANVRISTSIRFDDVVSPKAAWIYFGAPEEGDEGMYSFSINDAGAYELDRRAGQKWSFLQEWTNSPALHTGRDAENELSVEIRDSHIALYANGERLKTFDAGTPVRGYAGLQVNGPNSASRPERISFGHFRVVALP